MATHGVLQVQLLLRPRGVLFVAAVSSRQRFAVITRTYALASALALLSAVGCRKAAQSPPARTTAGCTEVGAKTGVAGAKTGATTAVEGVKAFGGAVGGFVEGGSDEAGARWQEGKANTRRAAQAGKGDVKNESHAPGCP
jgi:hypothetical protein